MIKQLVLLFNLISVVGFNFFYDEGVSVDVNAPHNASPGSEFIVELTIHKGSIDGFAKLQQDFPPGLTASKVETGNATFSFKDQTLKCIWMALPEDEEFKITYKVTVDENVNGVFQLDGFFSYISDNEKQQVNLPNITVEIGDVGKPAVAGGGSGPDKVEVQNREPQNGVLCTRTISPVKGKQKEFKVEIKVEATKEGFAKIEEFIPPGFHASEIESMEGLFSFKNQVVKIIWMSLPHQSEFIIAYKLVADEQTTGNQKINGAFSYIEGNETRKFILTPSNIFIEKDDEGIATIIIDDEGGTFTENLNIPKPEDDDDPIVEKPEPDPVPEPEPDPVVTNIPSPEADVIYKVQIAAGHKSVPGDYFEKKYSLTERISLENHEGWIKYTIGSYTVYKDGRDQRNKVWNSYNIKDAFVTAYNYGNRITVQEALMITNQKWYN